MHGETTRAALLTTAILTGLLHIIEGGRQTKKGEVRNLPGFIEAYEADRSCWGTRFCMSRFCFLPLDFSRSECILKQSGNRSSPQ